jgi:hypothetical protein
VIREQRPASRIHDRIDAAVPGGGANGLADRRLAVAEDGVCAESAHRLDLLGRADRRDHPCACELRGLHRRARDPAGRRRHEDSFAWPNPCDLGDHRPRGAHRALGRGCGEEVVVAAKRNDRACGHTDELCVSAPAIGAEHGEALAEILAPAGAARAAAAGELLVRAHRVSRGDPLHVGADLGNRPGELGAEHPGHRERPA